MALVGLLWLTKKRFMQFVEFWLNIVTKCSACYENMPDPQEPKTSRSYTVELVGFVIVNNNLCCYTKTITHLESLKGTFPVACDDYRKRNFSAPQLLLIYKFLFFVNNKAKTTERII